MKIQDITENYGKYIFPLVWAIKDKGMFKIAENFEHMQFDLYFPNDIESWKQFLQELHAGNMTNFPRITILKRNPVSIQIK